MRMCGFPAPSVCIRLTKNSRGMPLIRKRKFYKTVHDYSGGRKKTVRLKMAVNRQPRRQPGTSDTSAGSSFSQQFTDPEDDTTTTSTTTTCTTGQTRYGELKAKRLQCWQSIRPALIAAYIDVQVPPSLSCVVCEDDGDLYRCLDCSPWDVVCVNCLTERHRYPHLHIFEIWRSNAFVGCELDTPVWKTPGHGCTTSYLKTLVVVDVKGRQHERKLSFCQCETEAVQLVTLNLWPSTPKFPRLAFHMDFMRWLNGLLIEGHLSVKSFCESLKAGTSKHHRLYTCSKMQDIYKVLMTETVEEYRHFLYKTEHLSEDGTECPACFQADTRIISFDADFQLVRKASGGKHWGEPKHKGHFFLDQTDVDNFMKDYNCDRKKPDQECSEFQAGTNLRSKSKNHKLSETAVFGSVCRHEFPLYFFSLKHGERLGYSVYLLKRLLSDSTKPLVVMYDIACMLERHITAQKNHAWFQNVKLCLPIFHAYGHKVACQVLYGPRRTVGVGLTDGEGLERLWSYLGKFSRITKETTPENRIDLLVDALIHYGQKIREKLGKSLPAKLQKAATLQENSMQALQDLLQPLPGVLADRVGGWIDDEKAAFSTNRRDKAVFTPSEDYSLALESLHKHRTSSQIVNGWQPENDKVYKRLKARVLRLEKALCVQWTEGSTCYQQSLATAKDKQRRVVLERLQKDSSERQYLLDLMRKYARGQSIAIRLSKQLKKVCGKMKQSLAEYNGISGLSEKFPVSLLFDDVKDGNASFWECLELQPTAAVIPLSVQRQAIGLQCLVDRAKEEAVLVKQEMLSTIQWYANQHQQLLNSSFNATGGMKACIIREGLFCEVQIGHLITAFTSFVDVGPAPVDFAGMVGISLTCEPSPALLELGEELGLRGEGGEDSSDEEEDEEEDEESEDEDSSTEESI